MRSLQNVAFNPRLEDLAGLVAAKDLNYQIAVLAATFRRTTPSSGMPLQASANLVPTSPVFANVRIPNMTEIVGSDAGNLGPSFVANSGIHHGERRTVYIEDQPLYRGTFDVQEDAGTRKLLQDSYPASSFGDTHSIVLLVDSLAVMDVFARLAANGSGLTQKHIEKIFAASSRARAEATLWNTREGGRRHVGERTRRLRRLIVAPDVAATGTADDLNGGTWFATEARNRFHENVRVLNEKIKAAGLTGKLTFTSLLISAP